MHGSFWEIHLVVVLCVCVLEPVFMILPSSGQDVFGFSAPCSFTSFCHWESPASFLLPLFPFPAGYHLSLTLLSLLSPAGIAGSDGEVAFRRMKALPQGDQLFLLFLIHLLGLNLGKGT